MAVPVIFPIASQGMVAVARFKRLIAGQRPQDRHQLSIERCTVLPLSPTFVVALELAGVLNPSHAGHPSELLHYRNS